MDERRQELLNEISQLFSQYRREVPGPHRAWPESMKSRVAELRGTGMKFAEIARRTNLPYYTILKWHDELPESSFRLVKVVAGKKVASVTVARTAEKVASVTEVTSERVTIILPSGVRIEGMGVETLKRLWPTLSAGQP